MLGFRSENLISRSTAPAPLGGFGGAGSIGSISIAIALAATAAGLTAFRPAYGLLIVAPILAVALLALGFRPLLAAALVLSLLAHGLELLITGTLALATPAVLVLALLSACVATDLLSVMRAVRGPDLLAGAFWIWMSITILASPYVSGDFQSRVRAVILFAFWPSGLYVAGRLVFSSANRQGWLYLVGLIAVLATGSMWVEVVRGRPIIELSYLPIWTAEARFGSLLNGPNYASTFVALGFVAVLPFVSLGRASGRWSIVIGLFSLTAVLTTKSVSGLMTFLAAMAALAVVRIGWIPVLATGGALLFAGAGVLNNLNALPSTFRDPAYVYYSIEGRLEMVESAQTAFRFLWRDPISLITGVGYSGWNYLENFFAVGSVLQSDRVHGLHNTYLTLLFEAGFIGLILYVAFVLIAGIQAWRHRDDLPSLAGGLAVVVVLLAGIQGTLMIVPAVFGIAWFLLAAPISFDAMRSRTAAALREADRGIVDRDLLMSGVTKAPLAPPP